MKKHTYFISIIIIMFAAIAIKFLLVDIQQNLANIENGHANIENFDLNGKLTLNGQWEIYENVLLVSDNVNLDTLEKKYIVFPNQHNAATKNVTYASYRVVLEDVPTNEFYMVILDGISGGYALYINRELIYSNQKLMKNELNISISKEQDYYKNNDGSLEIVIEVSRFQLDYFGLTNAPKITTKKVFNRTLYITIGLNLIIFGGLLFALIYYILVIAIRTKDRSAIWFSLLCFAFGLYLFTYKSEYAFVIEKVLNMYDYYNYFYHFLSLYSTSILLYLTIKLGQKVKGWGPIDFMISFLSAVNIITPLFLNATIFLKNIHVFHLINIVNLIFITLWSLKQIKKNIINIYLTIALALLVIGNIYDSLVQFNIVSYYGKITYLIFYFSTFIFISINASNHESELSNVQEVIKLNDKIRDTEFTFLNTQIQSHFIYNTLNAIQSLCYSNPEKAGELIDDFSMYLRTRLEFNKMPMLIDFEDELENIRTYINIEMQRFGSRINVTYSLKVGDFKVPPLTIQPLVENSVKHGIGKKRLGGIINIATEEDEDFIYVSVYDNGVGFDRKSLSDRQRVGTQNIAHRLNLHINATLEIESVVNEGTRALIKIPKKK